MEKTKEGRGEGGEVKSVEGYHQTMGIERFGGLFCCYDENRVCGLTIQADTQHLFLLDLLGTGLRTCVEKEIRSYVLWHIAYSYDL